jgi:hypothetical protein
MLEQPVSGDRAVVASREREKKRKLCRREIDMRFTAPHFPPLRVDCEVANRDAGLRRIRPTVFGPPPNMRADPRHKFRRVEWLRQIVIRSEFQANDLVANGAAGGKHYDWHGVPDTDFAAQREPVHVREANIKDQEIETASIQRSPRIHGRSGLNAMAALLLQDAVKVRENESIVVHQQNGSSQTFHPARFNWAPAISPAAGSHTSKHAP